MSITTTSMSMTMMSTVTIMTMTTRSTSTIMTMTDHEHHHDHDHECDDPNCSCHHHHHHADEVFTSWGKETPKVFTQADIERILTALDSGDYGKILRAKGIVNGRATARGSSSTIVPEEHDVRAGHPDYTGRLCVIGAELKEDRLAELFGLLQALFS